MGRFLLAMPEEFDKIEIQSEQSMAGFKIENIRHNNLMFRNAQVNSFGNRKLFATSNTYMKLVVTSFFAAHTNFQNDFIRRNDFVRHWSFGFCTSAIIFCFHSANFVCVDVFVDVCIRAVLVLNLVASVVDAVCLKW